MSQQTTPTTLPAFLISGKKISELGVFGVISEGTRISCLPGHHVTVALPFNPTGAPETFIFNGIVEQVVFEAIETPAPGNDGNAVKIPKSIQIHNSSVDFPLEIRDYLKTGRQDYLQCAEHVNRKKVIGSVDVTPPIGLQLDYVLFRPTQPSPIRRMGSSPASIVDDSFSAMSLEEMWQIISDKMASIGQNIEIVRDSAENQQDSNVGSFLVRIPEKYILQDKTVIEQEYRRDPNTATAIIGLPKAFPDLNSIVAFTEVNSEGRKVTVTGTVIDFGIVETTDVEVGPIVQVSLKLLDGTVIRYNYKRLYATSIETMTDASIVVDLKPSDFGLYCQQYKNKAYDNISKFLSAFSVWIPADTEKSVRVTAINKQTGKPLHSWKPISSIFSYADSNGANISSFLGGTLRLADGEEIPVYYSDSRIGFARPPQDIDPSEYHELQSPIPEGAEFTSLRFSSMMGCLKRVLKAPTKVLSKSEKDGIYFSTNDGQPIVLTKLFECKSYEGQRICVDAIKDELFVGYRGMNKNPSHLTQEVVYWMPIDKAYSMFHSMITSTSFEQFKKKDIVEIEKLRRIFSESRFKYLVEVFDFLVHGMGSLNPNANTEYTKKFVERVLHIDHSILVEEIIPCAPKDELVIIQPKKPQEKSSWGFGAAKKSIAVVAPKAAVAEVPIVVAKAKPRVTMKVATSVIDPVELEKVIVNGKSKQNAKVSGESIPVAAKKPQPKKKQPQQKKKNSNSE